MGKTILGPNNETVTQADFDRYAHANKVQAEEIGSLRARLAEFDNVVIPSWKREESDWTQDRKDLMEELSTVTLRLADTLDILEVHGIHVPENWCWCEPTVESHADSASCEHEFVTVSSEYDQCRKCGVTSTVAEVQK